MEEGVGIADAHAAPSLPVLSGSELDEKLHIDVASRLGGGASGRVYEAKYQGQRVALKVLHPHAARKETEVNSFLREAYLLAELSHTNIIRVLAICHIPPAFCGLPTRRTTYGVILELAQAGTLSQAICSSQPARQTQQQTARNSKQGLEPLPTESAGIAAVNTPSAGAETSRLSAEARPSSELRSFVEPRTSSPRSSPQDGSGMRGRQRAAAYSNATAVSWCLDIARALEHLHLQQPPIVHRDVKPDNVLLVYDQHLGQPQRDLTLAHTLAKLADFGLHVVLDDREPGRTTSSMSEMLRREFIQTGGGSQASMQSGHSVTWSPAGPNPSVINGVTDNDQVNDGDSLLAPVLQLASPARVASPRRTASTTQLASPAPPASPTHSRPSPQNSAAQSLARRMSSFLIHHQSTSPALPSAPASKRPSSFLSAHSSDLLSAASTLHDDQPRPARANRRLSRQASSTATADPLNTRASMAHTAGSTGSAVSSLVAAAIPAVRDAPQQPTPRVRPPAGALSASLRLKFAATVSAPGSTGDLDVHHAPFEFDRNFTSPLTPDASASVSQEAQAGSLLLPSLAQSSGHFSGSGANPQSGPSMLNEDLRAALLRRQSSQVHPRDMAAGLEGRLSPKQSRHVPMWMRSASQGGEETLLALTTSPQGVGALGGRQSVCMSPTRMASAATSRLSHTGHQVDGPTSGRCTARPSRAPSRAPSSNLRDPPSRSSTRSTCEGEVEQHHTPHSPGNSPVGARRQLQLHQVQMSQQHLSQQSMERPQQQSQERFLQSQERSQSSQEQPQERLTHSHDRFLKSQQDSKEQLQQPPAQSQDTPGIQVEKAQEQAEEGRQHLQEQLQLSHKQELQRPGKLPSPPAITPLPPLPLLVAVPQLQDAPHDQPQQQQQQQRYLLQREGHLETHQPHPRRDSRLRTSDPKSTPISSKPAASHSDFSKDRIHPEDITLNIAHSKISVSDTGYAFAGGQVLAGQDSAGHMMLPLRAAQKRGQTQDQPVSRLRPASGRASLDNWTSRMPLPSNAPSTRSVWMVGASRSHEPAGVRRQSEERVTASQLIAAGSAPHRMLADLGAPTDAMKASIAASLLSGHSFLPASRAPTVTQVEAPQGPVSAPNAHRLRSNPASFNHRHSPLQQSSKNGAVDNTGPSMTRKQQLRMSYDASGVGVDIRRLSRERLISSTSLTQKTSSASRRSSEHNSTSEAGSLDPLQSNDILSVPSGLHAGSMHSSMPHLSRAVPHLRSRDGHWDSSPFLQRSLGHSPQHSRMMEASSANGALVQASEPSGSTGTGPSRVASAKPSMPGAMRNGTLAVAPSSMAARAAQQLLLRGGSSSMHAGVSLPQLSNISSSSPGHSVVFGARSRRSSERVSDMIGWSASEGGYGVDSVYALTGHAGTPLYMAPEVANQELYNEKADVFSFGIVMYEVLGRTLLLSGRTREEVNFLSARMQSGYRPRILECIPEGDMWHLIQWCWMQEPSKRPSMSQVVHCLEAIRAQLSPGPTTSTHGSVSGAAPSSPAATSSTPRRSADVSASPAPASRFARMVAASSLLQPRLSKKDAALQVVAGGKEASAASAGCTAASAAGALSPGTPYTISIHQSTAGLQDLDEVLPAGATQPKCCGCVIC